MRSRVKVRPLAPNRLGRVEEVGEVDAVDTMRTHLPKILPAERGIGRGMGVTAGVEHPPGQRVEGDAGDRRVELGITTGAAA